jgi:hypothetical protein
MALVGIATSPAAVAKTHRANLDPTIYSSIDAPAPGNNASEAFEATQTSEFGNQIAFAGTARVLDNVVVSLSSWGCQSGSQGVSNTGTISSPTPGSCQTSPGSTFSEPITLNIYNVGSSNAVGSVITTQTNTFAVPFRPSAVPVGYGPNPTGGCGDGASWFDAASNSCFHGYFTTVTFNFGHVVVPDKVIYGIAYNTSDYGYHPYGTATACHSTPQGCGYDSLNVGYSVEPSNPSVGSDPNLGTAYLNGTYAPFYCDNGAGGTGTFRIDGRPDTNNCWNGGGPNTGYSFDGIENGNSPVLSNSPYVVPSVQFNAVESPHATITSANHASVVAGTPFSFTVTTTGVPVPTLTERGKLPHGLTFKTNGDGTATIAGTALTTNRNRTYRFTLRAMNLNSGGRNRQTFFLTLTGGK